MELYELTASEVRRRIQANTLTLEQYVEALLARHKDRDAVVQAWAYLNPEIVIESARRLDRLAPEERGSLHGFVIGVKDIINTKDFPTRHNSSYHAEDGPQIDASTVAILRANGALIMGKTTTAEFAAGTTGPATCNPHDPTRSPGGSSSGSGAAVADRQVPIALGSQTIGSIVRPASFNGVYGFKPTWNAISSEGQKTSSPTLDTFGFMARSVEDIQAIADVFVLRDEVPPQPVQLSRAQFAVVKSPVWSQAGPGTINAMEKAVQCLRKAGAVVEEINLPADFDDIHTHQQRILQSEAGVAFFKEYSTARDHLSSSLKTLAEKVHTCSRKEFVQALDKVASLRPKIDEIADRYTAIITPSAVDVAPIVTDKWTGNPIFNGMWTALHVPVINVPGFSGEASMPVGVSLVTSRYRDQHLLQVAAVIGTLFEEADSRLELCQ
ncbi:amidase signature domain-containing protein [Plectosphaerella plurivora]|uniref:Amidase signature domain-containing protein n=1 Tax=Plectosphaerella plurivora TaxID=936078 RepID=A0A9P8VJJ9_9PEZI|nr:amidase signature domain-containing protein [Plectosphaerella plurivora]